MCTDPVFTINPILKRWYSGITAYYIFGVLDTSPILRFKRMSKATFAYFRSYWYQYRNTHDPKTLYENFFCKLQDGRIIPLFFLAPCGKCDACQLSYASELKSRLALEALTYGDNDIPFVTLTYSPEFRPIDGVCQEDVQKFLKRLRQNLLRVGLPNFMRPFYVSEYGTDPLKTHRPHYHLLLFGMDWSNHNSIRLFDHALRMSWKFGIVHWEMARDRVGCSKYVIKYVTKSVRLQQNVPYKTDHYGRLILDAAGNPALSNPNFWCGPRKAGLGIGMLDYIKENFDYRTETCVLVKRLSKDGIVLTSRVKVPKYILDKICPPLSRHVTKCLLDKFSRLISLHHWLLRFGPSLGYERDVLALPDPNKYAEFLTPFVPRDFFFDAYKRVEKYKEHLTYLDAYKQMSVKRLGSGSGGTTQAKIKSLILTELAIFLLVTTGRSHYNSHYLNRYKPR